MINAIINGIFNLVIGLVEVILSPIDTLIQQFLPDLSVGINAIGSVFNLAGNYLGFVVSLVGLSSACLSLIVGYYTFKLTVPWAISLIKNAIAWYRSLKL